MSARRTTQSKTGAQGMTALRVRYVQLVRQGLSNGEICRILGVGRRTGTKWRYGYQFKDAKTGRMYSYLPIADFTRPHVSSPRFLSEEERIRIADLIRAGKSIRAVAASLGRSPSTISRERRRNSVTPGRYTPHRAHQQARQRRFRRRPGKIAATPLLRLHIQELMKRRWSPAHLPPPGRDVTRPAVDACGSGDDLSRPVQLARRLFDERVLQAATPAAPASGTVTEDPEASRPILG